ncbi:MAG: lycopene cyclase family protein [Algibacter sp.]|uniref:lycopene cyclase family protein n=1 Tax=Algibacter sp. TaxID=1872428 RepID=UPI00262922BE|nr:lycopene cyclase family protein [Algibacter sp.]MDG1731278.1 lycopene cyclase family protein [Algibacter sp.]MDG2179851.1 lycopene cyclase family protein [Algibacter sp.]
MADNNHFDYIIIGNGLAGLQLALKMASDVFFDEKRIALIDNSQKNTNDKTWSFWETEPSHWNNITHQSWNKASIITSKKQIDLNLNPYHYKSIRSIDFYNYSKKKLSKKINIEFIIEHVESLNEDDIIKVSTNKNTYRANHVFDSRIPETFSIDSKNSISIIQHFKGWVIKTDNKAFDKNRVTMMDYRLKDGEQTTFTYVLPFSETEALVEFTYFTSQVVNEDTYDAFIKKYIKAYLNIENYSIIETEKGQIPMTNFSFEKFNTKKVTKIGTGGGWVKGSTGYSFKHTEKKTTKIIENIKANKLPSNGLFNRRYKFYDKVFLKVLKDENHKGEWLFQQFYDKNSIQTMFRFLDEESTFLEELKIMWSLFSWSFIKAFFKTL